MNGVLLVLIILVVAAIGLAVWSASRNAANRSAASLADAKADARRVIERLGGQVINLTGTDDASKQALADASERYTAAGSQIDQATTAKQALLAKESAMEGLYYVRAARTAMGMDPGPELESLAGQQSAGTVTEDRRVNFEGRDIEASPNPTERTPNYYPGGRVAGRLFRRAGTRSRGGSLPLSRARGASARCCFSMRCSPACTAWTTEPRASKVVTVTAIPMASMPARMREPTAAASMAATAAAVTAAGAAATAGWGGGDGGWGGGDFGGGDFGGF